MNDDVLQALQKYYQARFNQLEAKTNALEAIIGVIIGASHDKDALLAQVSKTLNQMASGIEDMKNRVPENSGFDFDGSEYVMLSRRLGAERL